MIDLGHRGDPIQSSLSSAPLWLGTLAAAARAVTGPSSFLPAEHHLSEFVAPCEVRFYNRLPASKREPPSDSDRSHAPGFAKGTDARALIDLGT